MALLDCRETVNACIDDLRRARANVERFGAASWLADEMIAELRLARELVRRGERFEFEMPRELTGKLAEQARRRAFDVPPWRGAADEWAGNWWDTCGVALRSRLKRGWSAPRRRVQGCRRWHDSTLVELRASSPAMPQWTTVNVTVACTVW